MPDIQLNPPQFTDWPQLLALLQEAFAFMDGRIDPPSSLHRLDEQSLCEKAYLEDVFLIIEGGRIIACQFGAKKDEAYYLGKIAVRANLQGQGLAKHLMQAAETHARALGCTQLELETRVELFENQRAFRRLGFRLAGANAHKGYNRATSFRFYKPL